MYINRLNPKQNMRPLTFKQPYPSLSFPTPCYCQAYLYQGSIDSVGLCSWSQLIRAQHFYTFALVPSEFCFLDAYASLGPTLSLTQ